MIRSLKEGRCSGLVLCHVGNVMKEIHPDVIAVCGALEFPRALETREKLLQKVINEEGLGSIAQFVGQKLGTAIVIEEMRYGYLVSEVSRLDQNYVLRMLKHTAARDLHRGAAWVRPARSAVAGQPGIKRCCRQLSLLQGEDPVR